MNGHYPIKFRLVERFIADGSKYESYVDLLPGGWTKVKIDVRGDRARLYVRGQEQATLIVNDPKAACELRDQAPRDDRLSSAMRLAVRRLVGAK